MTKEERKVNKIKAQVEILEMQLKRSIGKKANGASEVNLGAITSRIADLRKQL